MSLKFSQTDKRFKNLTLQGDYIGRNFRIYYTYENETSIRGKAFPVRIFILGLLGTLGIILLAGVE